MKIYQMPRIDFIGTGDENIKKAKSLCFDFVAEEVVPDMRIALVFISRCDHTYIFDQIKYPTQTFEQAVTTWLSNWIRSNFEPIVFPLTNMFEEYEYTHELLELNPNMLKDAK